MTPTFKHKKQELTRQGFDPAMISDPLYFDDPATAAYVRLDAALYQRIDGGKIRL
jgi:fatty-acyl-CoA synthase